jgi:N-acetylmuramoyl-L-alanine amidase
MSKYKYILDNGHGGMINGVYQTNGKCSPVWPDGRQLFEGEFNRDIVKRLSNMLTEANIQNFILVSEESDISLAQRVIRANNINLGHNKQTVLVSIHANAGGGTGFEVHTYKGQSKSDKLATIFHQEMVKQFPTMKARGDWSDGEPDWDSDFAILRNTSMPAILTENFFMDTLTPDCELLMSDEGREKIAIAHYNAIMIIESNNTL